MKLAAFALPGVKFVVDTTKVRLETVEPLLAQRLVLQAWELGVDVRQTVDERGVQIVEWQHVA